MIDAPVDAAPPAARLRPLTLDDLTRVAELERQLFGPSAWTEAMLAAELHAPGRWYVAVVEGDDTLVGYAGLWFDGDVTQVMTIGVAPAVQRQGLGTALMSALVERSRQLGAGAVLLEVRVDNAPALAMYERFGFTVLRLRRRYYQPEDADAWTMRLALEAPDEAEAAAQAEQDAVADDDLGGGTGDHLGPATVTGR